MNRRAFLGGVLATTAARSPARAGIITIRGISAAGLGSQTVRVLLPPGYAQSGRRYGVLYVQDGQAAFGDPRTGFAIDAAMRRAPPWIVVAVDNAGLDRFHQFLPQAVYDRAGPALRARLDAELAGRAILSGAFLDFMAGPLKMLVDARFRTLPDREATAMLGASMAGPFAATAMIERPEVYGRVACLSPQWPYYDRAMIDPPELRDELWPALFATLGPPDGRRLWLETGTTMIDAGYPPYQDRIADTLRARGWRDGRNLVARVWSGGTHDWSAWSAHLPTILPWLLA